MTLRCKPGDLAIVIHCDFPENIGKLVTVAQRITDKYSWYAYDGEEWECTPLSPMYGWINDSKTWFELSNEPIAYLDAHLRPIRDADGCDETLAWADVPNKEVV